MLIGWPTTDVRRWLAGGTALTTAQARALHALSGSRPPGSQVRRVHREGMTPRCRGRETRSSMVGYQSPDEGRVDPAAGTDLFEPLSDPSGRVGRRACGSNLIGGSTGARCGV